MTASHPTANGSFSDTSCAGNEWKGENTVAVGVNQPLKNDVVCGRGGLSNTHVGNLHFRKLVEFNKRLYVSCSKRNKALVARSIEEAIRTQTPPGRFLQRDTGTGLWYEVSRKKALFKTSQALREGAFELRREMGSNARSEGKESISFPEGPSTNLQKDPGSSAEKLKRSRPDLLDFSGRKSNNLTKSESKKKQKTNGNFANNTDETNSLGQEEVNSCDYTKKSNAYSEHVQISDVNTEFVGDAGKQAEFAKPEFFCNRSVDLAVNANLDDWLSNVNWDKDSEADSGTFPQVSVEPLPLPLMEAENFKNAQATETSQYSAEEDEEFMNGLRMFLGPEDVGVLTSKSSQNVAHCASAIVSLDQPPIVNVSRVAIES